MLRLLIFLGLFGSWLTFVTQAKAQQIIPDNTLGSKVDRSGNAFTITNGSAAGSNLFHSFREFSIPTGGSATFDLMNTPNISTIFSRVTGGSVSNIDGVIRTINNSNAVNLFLINPAGILFGSNASLNISGSFTATTADSIFFADGMKFHVTNPTEPPLLTISVPVGLQLGANAGLIQVQGQPQNPASGLQVQTGRTLALAGSQIDLTGATLKAPDGQVELWAAQNAQIAMNKQPWQLNSSTAEANWGNISLRQSSRIDAGGVNGGAIHVRGRGLTLQDGSNMSSTTSAGQGKGITIQTTEFVDLLGMSSPGQLLLSGINTSVGNQFSFLAPPGPPMTGRAGDIKIDTLRLRLANGAWLQSSTSGNNSRTGDISIHATDVDLVGYETAFSLSIVNSIGTLITARNNNQSGRVSVDAQRVRVLDGSRISSSLLGGNGTAGEVSIRAAESLEIRGINPNGGITSAVLASIEAGARGQSGQITIETGSLILANGGSITSELAGASNTFFGPRPGAQGTAGSITIRAKDVQVSDVKIDGFSRSLTGITASLGNGAVGSGGTINLTADNLRVLNGGQITSAAEGQGAAGSIILQAKNIDVQGVSQPLSDGRILLSTISSAAAGSSAAGSVNLQADIIRVDGAELSVSNRGTGDAGNLNLSAGSILLKNGANLQAEVNGGNQGNIQLQARELLLLRQNSKIITSATGLSTGGNIAINAPNILGLGNSDIVANAEQGRGGNIQITTQNILGLQYRDRLTPENDITASSKFGINGTVQVNNAGVDPNSGLIQLSTDILDPTQQITATCAANQGSSFVVTGRGGVPINPMQDTRHDRTWNDVRDLSHFPRLAINAKHNAEAMLQPIALMEATTWYRNLKTGKVEIVATQPAKISSTATCAATP
ncbi:beta strand repeat-containing protein [Leptolyngbya sp. GGD]|uniref:beta strand repeat-containing protein n=1 Tax=Leptolyngbya sp. GGD TaxID=2997907 RepID=UPI00227C5CAF|nr:S-layer family protein [Leptolyngbya sp. GGD]MCY6491003.1 S-layer family protein [Leptolyngbya sp. GGD]